MELMNAVVISEPRRAAAQRIPIPTPQKGEALLKMLVGGVCGSDLASYRGQSAYVSYPRVIGHEFAAQVVEAEKVEKGFYFCDSFGFKEVSFDPSKAQKSERFCDFDHLKTIEVLFVQPDKAPQLIRIEDSLAGIRVVKSFVNENEEMKKFKAGNDNFVNAKRYS